MGRIRKNKIPFYVIIDDVNRREFIKYDVMPYFVNSYKQCKNDRKPKTYDDFLEFVKQKGIYMYWGRCEWELILKPWVSRTNERKIDVYWQITNNIDVVTRILMFNCGINDF